MILKNLTFLFLALTTLLFYFLAMHRYSERRANESANVLASRLHQTQRP